MTKNLRLAVLGGVQNSLFLMLFLFGEVKCQAPTHTKKVRERSPAPTLNLR
ncbi:hypothetical protein [Microcoleus sp. herbarium12]|uniref:hypothetical protein n=1 Tax=Microcoleus sp. herbarium12 TaxID=3055437 RepID=UPI002FD5C170